MIEFKKGNIFDEHVEAIVNPINCVGVMGKGLALQFKKAYPENFRLYAKACVNNKVAIGRLLVYCTGSSTNPRYIINFPTKHHWRNKSKIADIKAGLHALVDEVPSWNIKSIAIPALGCGLGGLPWAVVRWNMDRILSRLVGVKIIILEPER